MKNVRKPLGLALTFIAASFGCFYFSNYTCAETNTAGVKAAGQGIETLQGNSQGTVLYEQNVGSLSNEQVDGIWPTNNPRSWVLTGVMDGEVTKRYKSWGIKYKNQVAGTKDQRGLETGADFTLYLKNLNIKTSDYRDIRLFLDYVSNGGSSCVTNSYSFEVYAVGSDNKTYGPFRLESFEPNGFYSRTQGANKVYDRGFLLVTERIRVPQNTVIKTLEIKPYANYPVRLRASQQQASGKAWRGSEALLFGLAGLKVAGYPQNYQRPAYVKTKAINVDRVREKAVKRMYDLATVKWTPTVEMQDMHSNMNGAAAKSVFRPGSIYYGPPYTQRNRVPVETFASKITNGKLARPDNLLEVWGVDCVGSVEYSISKFIPMPVIYLTPDFIWDRNKTTLRGNLKIDGRAFSSESLKQRYSDQEIYKAYAQLEKGDVVCTHWQKGAHARLVSGNTHVARGNGGQIDPDASYFIITETSSDLSDTANKNNYGGLIGAKDYVVSFEPKPEYTDLRKLSDLAGKNTNFRANKKITFKQAYNGCYVPITLNSYLTATTEEPYARLINPNTVADIGKGFKGTVYSNYTILRIKYLIKNNETGETRVFTEYPGHASGTLEGKYNSIYSLYHNTPAGVQNYVRNMLKNSRNFEVSVSVSAGENEDMEVLRLKS